jgi:hypothetical protein
MTDLHPWFLDHLCCPRDQTELAPDGSVLQHTAKADVELVLRGVARMPAPGGSSLIPTVSAYGVLFLYHQLGLGLLESRAFEVGYCRQRELHHMFAQLIRERRLEADCFFGWACRALMLR